MTPRRKARGWRVAVSAAAPMAALVAAYYLIPMASRGSVVVSVLVAAVVFGAVPASIYYARIVLVSDRPGLVAVRAATLLGTVAIVAFASSYYVLAHQRTGQMSGIHTKTDALYFTMTVISTVGFGDITPTGQGARLLVTTQMVFDIAFIAVAARLLVRAVEKARDRS